MEWTGKLSQGTGVITYIIKSEIRGNMHKEELDNEYNSYFRAFMFNISGEFYFLLLDCCYHFYFPLILV